MEFNQQFKRHLTLNESYTISMTRAFLNFEHLVQYYEHNLRDILQIFIIILVMSKMVLGMTLRLKTALIQHF